MRTELTSLSQTSPAGKTIRDGETTIKIKFVLLRGGGHWGREESRPKTLFFFCGKLHGKFYWRENFVVIAHAPKMISEFFRGVTRKNR